MKIKIPTGLGLLLISCALSHGQLRIVQYNLGEVKNGTSTVLQQIGNEIVNGIARPIDVLVVEEQADAAAVANLAATMNSLYGAGTYVAAPYVGQSSGSGLPAMVYRASSVSLIGPAVNFGTVSTSGNARQTIRYQLRLAGYDSTADLYLYASHFKANPEDAARRNVEAQTNRGNADALGAGKNVIFAGDFNLYSGNEPAFQTLLAPGNAQAFDPVNAPFDWSSSRIHHTQSPATVQAYDGQITGGMDDRFDFQLISAQLTDREGLAYIPGSYRVFGNNGTHRLNRAISDGSNTWNNAGITIPRTSVLNSIAIASDHTPVVADYQLPARMSVSVGTIATPQVIVGAGIAVPVTVANSAPVATANGADELDYTVTGNGWISGLASGIATATFAGNAHSLVFDTSSPGLKTGSVSVSSTSQSAASASFSQSRSLTVLGHATPSLAPQSVVTSQSIDFGIVALGSAVDPIPFSIYNLAHPSGFTATLDIDTVSASGDSQILTTTLAESKNLLPGLARSLDVLLDTSLLGSFAAEYAVSTSDQDLPGAAALGGLTVMLRAIVALGGDANLDGVVDITDLGALATNWQSSGDWMQGDFDRSGFVDISDLGLLATNWQSGAGELSLWTLLDELGIPGAAVPEPSVALTWIAAMLPILPRRRSAR